MAREIKIGSKVIGDGQPAYLIAEIGINHNGSLDTAKEMIMAAQETGAGCGQISKTDAGTMRSQRPVGYHARNSLGIYQLPGVSKKS